MEGVAEIHRLQRRESGKKTMSTVYCFKAGSEGRDKKDRQGHVNVGNI